MRGITVTLYAETPGEPNTFGEETFVETPVQVDNVLIAPSSSQEILDATNLYGKIAVYTLAIPKGDTHDWQDKTVEFFGERWRTFGIPLEGLDHLIPLEWNKKVTVERSDGGMPWRQESE